MSPRGVEKFLAAADGADVTFLVNSPGGEVSAAGDICSQLDMYTGKITMKVVGDAASCGSLVAACGDRVEIGKLGMFMIHQPWSIIVGNSVAMRAEADCLDEYGKGFIDIYAERMDREKAAEMMGDGKDHWIGASDAIDMGLADAKLNAKDADAKSGADAAPARSGSADADAKADDATDGEGAAAGSDGEDQNTDAGGDADAAPSDPGTSGDARSSSMARFGRSHSLLLGLSHITPDDCAGDISHGTHLRSGA